MKKILLHISALPMLIICFLVISPFIQSKAQAQQVQGFTPVFGGYATSFENNMGYQFSPTTNGYITALWCYNSAPETVFLWTDNIFTRNTPIASATVNCNSVGWASTAISPIFVAAGSNYRVSGNGTNYYAVIPAATYGNIKLLGGVEGGASSYPNFGTGTTVGLTDVTFSPSSAPPSATPTNTPTPTPANVCNYGCSISWSGKGSLTVGVGGGFTGSSTTPPSNPISGSNPVPPYLGTISSSNGTNSWSGPLVGMSCSTTDPFVWTAGGEVIDPTAPLGQVPYQFTGSDTGVLAQAGAWNGITYIMNNVASSGPTASTAYEVGGKCPVITPPTLTPTLTPTPPNTPTPTVTPTPVPGAAWWQAIGLDVRQETGYNDPVPTATPGPVCPDYALAPVLGGDAGVLFTGQQDVVSNPDPSKISSSGWHVGGSDPALAEQYNAFTGVSSNTSYGAMLSRLKRSGIDCLAGINCKDITSDVAGGTLPAMTSGEHEYIINTVGGTGTVTLGNTSTPAPTYTFPGGGNYIILVNGNLNIDTKITVPTTSTVLFSVSGNITVGSNVGDPLP